MYYYYVNGIFRRYIKLLNSSAKSLIICGYKPYNNGEYIKTGILLYDEQYFLEVS